jgi:hypothetical protein
MTAASLAAKSYITKLSEAHSNEALRADYAKMRDAYDKK